MLPIVERELRVRCRDPRTFRRRVLVGGLASGVSLLFLLNASLGSTPASTGRMLFAVLCWPTFVLCLLEGVRVTSGCLTEEKQQGTLGLLFLTELRPVDIVLGKLAGVALNSIYGLFSLLPVLALPLLLGGVTAGEFWRLVLTLVAALSFSLSVGIAVSAWSRDTTESWLWTGALVAAAAILLPVLSAAASAAGLTWISLGPTPPMFDLEAGSYDSEPWRYWAGIGSTVATSLLCLILACGFLPRRWQAGAGSGDAAKSRRRRGNAADRAKVLDRRPTEWLSSLHSGRERVLNGFLAATVTLVLLATILDPAGLAGAAGVPSLIVFPAVHFFLTARQALRAVRVGASLRGSGDTELISVTPLAEREIVIGFAAGLLRPIQPAAVMLAATECLILVSCGFSTEANHPGGWGLSALLAWMVLPLIASALLDFRAATWMGLYYGLTKPRQSAAIGWTVGLVQLVPLGFYTCCFYLGPLLGLAKSLTLLSWSRDILIFRFTDLARGISAPPPSQDLVREEKLRRGTLPDVRPPASPR